MAVELKVPAVGESITEVRIAAWFKAPGERVERDEPLVELESDKATIELPAPEAGILAEIRKGAGATASIGEVIGLLARPGGEGRNLRHAGGGAGAGGTRDGRRVGHPHRPRRPPPQS